MDQVSGITGAGPLFHAVMEAAMARREKHPAPASTRRARTSGAPRPRRRVPALRRRADGRVPRARPRVAPRGRRARSRALRRARGGGRRPPQRAARRARLPRGPSWRRACFERYDPDYLAWAGAAGRPLAPEGFSPLCPADEAAGAPGASEGPVRITYPHDGARFLIDPDRPRELQAVPVLVAAPSGVREVTLRIDDAAPVRLAPPFSTTWRLETGEHTFVAAAPGREGDARVHVTVR